MTTLTHPTELDGFLDRWSEAICTNDVAEMARFTTADWILVGAQGSMTRQQFHDVVAGGHLQHHTMSHDIIEIRMLTPDSAFLRTRGRNTGTYQGAPLEADEWTTDVVVRTSDGWRCVLTHLTAVAQ